MWITAIRSSGTAKDGKELGPLVRRKEVTWPASKTLRSTVLWYLSLGTVSTSKGSLAFACMENKTAQLVVPPKFCMFSKL